MIMMCPIDTCSSCCCLHRHSIFSNIKLSPKRTLLDENLWKTHEKPMNFPVRKPMKYLFSCVFSKVFSQVFTWCEILKTCEQGTFHRVKTCEKTCEKESCSGAFSHVFSRGLKSQNLWTGHFSRSHNLWKKSVKKPVKKNPFLELFHSTYTFRSHAGSKSQNQWTGHLTWSLELITSCSLIYIGKVWQAIWHVIDELCSFFWQLLRRAYRSVDVSGLLLIYS